MDNVVALLTDPRVLALVSPLIVAGLKKATSALPTWALPIVSVLAGSVLSAVAGGDVVGGGSAGLLGGSAGVGVREAIDQGRKASGM